MFKQITILGPGLLGASLAMAIKRYIPNTTIVIWARKPESRAKCQDKEWCDTVSETPEKAVSGSDLILLGTPVNTILPLLEQIQPLLKAGSVVSDVGSTKAFICRGAQKIFKNTNAVFLGSHPMAGSDQSGMEHARYDLFKDAACIITPLLETPTAITKKMSTFWKLLEMNVTSVSPEIHDAIVAHISHLPHILASVLCNYLAQKDTTWQRLAGGGLRDTTRIAAGDPELWKQILEQNRDEVLHAIDGFEHQLDALKKALAANDSNSVLSQLKQGKDYRDRL